MEYEKRAGFFMNASSGYKAFVPAPLPPEPPIQYDEDIQSLLSQADRKLGRLDGITQILPNPELFVAMYVKKEAVLSSQIEGTQASFVDVLSAEYNQIDDQRQDDISEVVNYVNAMNWGLEQLETFPLSLRLIKNIHKRLLQNTRGPKEVRGNSGVRRIGLALRDVILIQQPLSRRLSQIWKAHLQTWKNFFIRKTVFRRS